MTNGVKLFETFSTLCTNPKVQALECTLVQSFANFKDILLEFEGISNELENFKIQSLIQKEKCESKSCASSKELKQIIVEKDKIIHSIANILLEINETKKLDIITDAFRIISGEQCPLSPHNFTLETKSSEIESALIEKDNIPRDKEFTSTSEIETIPSGRKSPIIQTKKYRNPSVDSIDNAKVQEKKKCPEVWHVTDDDDYWPTSEKKMLKLVFATPGKSKSNVKLRQARLNFVKEKETTVVDLTCSPKETNDVSSSSISQSLKKEIFENDDTILPSPTSGTINYNSIYKPMCKGSPRKTKKPLSMIRLKTKDKEENISDCGSKGNKPIEDEHLTEHDAEETNILRESNKSSTTPRKKTLSTVKLMTECTTFVDENDENATQEVTRDAQIEQSINILGNVPDRLKTPAKPQNLKLNLKFKQHNQDGNESMSLLHRINKFEDRNQVGMGQPCSPIKRPSSQNDMPASLSVLSNNFVAEASTSNNASKRTKPIDQIFKEPTVRKKAEKLALPGWSCEQCKQFYEKLYKDDPEMLREKMSECSRHRGRRDPARPRTPPGYWQLRWHVPDDTDEFNRLNDAE